MKIKKFNPFIGLCLLLTLLIGACEDGFENVRYPDGPLVLSASKLDVQLDVATPESDAVVFTWTPGSNLGTNAAIHYVFELAKKGSGFVDAITVELDKGNTSVSYRNGAFNALLIDEMGAEPNADVELEARVTAHVQSEGIAPKVSEAVSVKVTTYKPLTPALYLIGNATPNGWNAGEASEMTAEQGAAGVFVWQGSLTPGEFKFITTLGQFAPSYNRGDDDAKLYYRESFDDPYDVPFVITEPGGYQVKVNLISMTIEIKEMEGPAYSELWFVGGFTGWSFQPMTRNAGNPFIFHYNGVLASGGGSDEFKIATVPDFDPSVVFLRPETNNQGVGTELPVVSWSESMNSDDFKWRIDDGVYKIKLDIRENLIDIAPFTPFEVMYLVGDATPNGWDVGNATPMVKSGTYEFTWTGTLKAGELKFSCDKQTDWNGAWFLAAQNGMEPSGAVEQMLFNNPGSGPDYKWKVVTPGTYTITLDQLKETVVIARQ
ncbi:SusF/SusE family outer membrane protein [Parapedobacter pyrenivorans]|nr:SusF/SusE family outer membrane protein [Parapedobacter pyrenivorans]